MRSNQWTYRQIRFIACKILMAVDQGMAYYAALNHLSPSRYCRQIVQGAIYGLCWQENREKQLNEDQVFRQSTNKMPLNSSFTSQYKERQEEQEASEIYGREHDVSEGVSNQQVIQQCSEADNFMRHIDYEKEQCDSNQQIQDAFRILKYMQEKNKDVYDSLVDLQFCSNQSDVHKNKMKTLRGYVIGVSGPTYQQLKQIILKDNEKNNISLCLDEKIQEAKKKLAQLERQVTMKTLDSLRETSFVRHANLKLQSLRRDYSQLQDKVNRLQERLPALERLKYELDEEIMRKERNKVELETDLRWLKHHNQEILEEKKLREVQLSTLERRIKAKQERDMSNLELLQLIGGRIDQASGQLEKRARNVRSLKYWISTQGQEVRVKLNQLIQIKGKIAGQEDQQKLLTQKLLKM